MDKSVTVSVPAGHHVQVHAPMAPPMAPGMIHDPMAVGGKAAMDAALMEEAGETPAQEAKEQASGAEKRESVHKKPKAKAKAKAKKKGR